MNFASDNTAGIAPEILHALAAGNDGFAHGLRQRRRHPRGRAADRRDVRARRRGVPGADRHGGECAGARACQPALGRGVCACRGAHPDRRMRRAGILRRRPQACRHAGRRLQGRRRRRWRKRWSQYEGHTPHQVVPAAFSFAQASEAGTIYRADEIAALAEVAHAHGMKVHMDGARFANALVRLNASPAEITWKAGVDVLSFGATKGGALAAEAVVFFDRARGGEHGRAAQARRASAVQAPLPGAAVRCLPQQRLLAPPGAPRQCDGRPAGGGLAAAGYPPVWPVEANLVFIVVPKAVESAAAGRRRAILCAPERQPAGGRASARIRR